jgi:CMP-N,N'-diacetyllegionaminic acid synthase
MNVLGVVLARAGSVGLKNKHLLPLLGRPVVCYTLEHAKQSRLLNKTVVSSDSRDVLNLAAEAGLETIARPANLATEDASVQDVLLHALQMVESTGRFTADAIVTLYGNVPVRGDGVIDRAIAVLQSSGCDSVRSFRPVGKFHPDWMSRIENDRVIPTNPNSIHRRQDLEPLYIHDGAVVAVTRKALLRARDNPQDPHAFFGEDRRAILTSASETVEIDQLMDFFLTEAILRHQQTQIPLRKAS